MCYPVVDWQPVQGVPMFCPVTAAQTWVERIIKKMDEEKRAIQLQSSVPDRSDTKQRLLVSIQILEETIVSVLNYRK